MTTLLWSQAGKRTYEIGIDRGVLYPQTGNGIPWMGLTSVNEDLSEESVDSFFYDGIKYLDFAKNGNYAAVLKAFTYPDEFMEYEGMGRLGSGIYADDQRSKTFGLSYRTKIGNDTEGTDFAYKLHLVYNLTAIPEPILHETLSDAPEAVEFSWLISGVPVKTPGYRPTAHIIFDSRFLPQEILHHIEDILYGDNEQESRLPDFEELKNIFDNWRYLVITDNGDGTWTATTIVDGIITFIDPTTFKITDPAVEPIDGTTYRISTR